MMTVPKLFWQRLASDWKYQYEAWKTVQFVDLRFMGWIQGFVRTVLLIIAIGDKAFITL